MKIGIDIDGCITDSEKYMFDYASKYAVENNLQCRVKNPKSPCMEGECGTYGWNDHDTFAMLDIYWNEFLKSYPRPFVAEVIKKLKSEGHEIIIITARSNGSTWSTTKERDYVEESTKKLLKRHKIKYDKIYFGKDKAEVIKQEKIDLHIDDMPKNIVDLSKIVPVVIMNTIYNQDLNIENTYRVYSWYEFYALIKELSKKN